MTCLAWFLNSSNFRGRLSKADGSRNPYRMSFSLRDRSPRYIPFSCGMVAWLSSIIKRESLGK